MIILIDTREQKLLEFNHEYIENCERIKLDVGDYGVRYTDGYVPPLYFERKSIGDLYGTMGKGYARFKKEMQRAENGNATLVLIIEGTMTKVAKGCSRSTIKGYSMIYKLFTLWIKHNLQVVYTKSRKEMSEYITQTYIAIGKERERNKRESRKKKR